MTGKFAYISVCLSLSVLVVQVSNCPNCLKIADCIRFSDPWISWPSFYPNTWRTRNGRTHPILSISSRMRLKNTSGLFVVGVWQTLAHWTRFLGVFQLWRPSRASDFRFGERPLVCGGTVPVGVREIKNIFSGKVLFFFCLYCEKKYWTLFSQRKPYARVGTHILVIFGVCFGHRIKVAGAVDWAGKAYSCALLISPQILLCLPGPNWPVWPGRDLADRTS